MKRKVIQIADSTMLVSLPKKWADGQNIKKGDEIEVEDHGGSLVISAHSEPEVKKGVIDLRGMSTLKRRSICAAYLKGYDELEIIYDKPDYITVIQDVLSEFIGYDIIKQGKNSCIIKQISKPTEIEFDNVFNRIFLLLHDTLSSIVDAARKNDHEGLKATKFREANINKFTNFCRRIVNKRGYEEYEKTTNMYFILTSLEFLGDEYKEISLDLADMGNIDKSILDVLEQTNTLFNGVTSLFKKFAMTKAVENAIIRDNIVKELDNLAKKRKIGHIPLDFHLMRSVQIIIQMQEAILQLYI